MVKKGCIVATAAVVAVIAGIVVDNPFAEEDGRMIRTTLPWFSCVGGAKAKSEKANGIYWMYVDSPKGDGVRILLESGSEFKIVHEDGAVVIDRGVVTLHDIVVPETLGGKKVLELGGEDPCLFDCCIAMTSISIPNGVTNLFYEDNPLIGHRSLKKIVVSKDHPAYSVRGEALYDKSCKTLLWCPTGMDGGFVIPDGVETISGEAFSGCSRIRSLAIPSSVRRIRGGLVPWGVGLREVHISDIASWCGIEFERTNVHAGDDVGSSNPLVWAHNLYVNGKLVTDVVIPEGVGRIGDMAFVGCSCLRSVSLPDSVTNIGWSAFAGCTALEEIKIGRGVKSIGDSAFAKCTSLREIAIPDSVVSIGSPVGASGVLGVFHGCTSLQRVMLPRGLREISENMFSGCTELRGVAIPQGVERIGAGTFYGCKLLRNVEIPDGVTEIGVSGSRLNWGLNGTFEDCGLYEIEIPASVKKIGARTFAGCENLSYVKTGSGVKSVGVAAFDGCRNLKFDANPLPGFKMRNGIVVGLTSPLDETLDLTGTEGISDDAIGGLQGASAGDVADPEPEKLRRIIFPDGMETINLDIFSGCENLQELTIPPSVKEVNFSGLGGVAFCRKHLKKVNIRDVGAWCKIDFGVSLLIPCPHCCPGDPGVPRGSTNPLDAGAALYQKGKKLTKIVIPGTTKRIGRGAFYGYGELESVVIEDGVAEIGDFAFCNCSNLVSVVRPDNVLMGRDAFSGCTSLKTDVYSQPYMLKYGHQHGISQSQVETAVSGRID